MFQIMLNSSLDKTEQFEPKYWCKYNISHKILVRNITSKAPPAMVQDESNFSVAKSLKISNFQPMKNIVPTKKQLVSHVSKMKFLIQTCMTCILKELLDINFQSVCTQRALPTPNLFCSQLNSITQLCQSKQLANKLCTVPRTRTVTKTATKAMKKRLAANKKEKLMKETAAAHKAALAKESKTEAKDESGVKITKPRRRRNSKTF
jgi:hypothetical protein